MTKLNQRENHGCGRTIHASNRYCSNIVLTNFRYFFGISFSYTPSLKHVQKRSQIQVKKYTSGQAFVPIFRNEEWILNLSIQVQFRNKAGFLGFAITELQSGVKLWKANISRDISRIDFSVDIKSLLFRINWDDQSNRINSSSSTQLITPSTLFLSLDYPYLIDPLEINF